MESKERCPRIPLGSWPKKVEISAEEMHLAYLHREATGEPIQTWIRRMIRERWEIKENMKGTKLAGSVWPDGHTNEHRGPKVLANDGVGDCEYGQDAISRIVGQEVQTRFPGW